MSLRRTPLVSMAMLNRTVPQVALDFGANTADGADDILAVGENGLDRDVVVVPIVVGRFSSVGPLTCLEATRHLGQVPCMRAWVGTIASCIRVRAIAAYLPPTDSVRGGLIPVEARANHGHAEAVADANVEVGSIGSDGPFELGVTAAIGVHARAGDEHGAGICEADGANWLRAELAGIAARSTVPPVPEVVTGGSEGDADSVAAAAGTSCDRATSGSGVGGGIGGRGGSRIGRDSCGC